jgi:ParB family chromosome partitioning protein
MVEMKVIQKIPLQQINLSDDTFSANYLPNLKKLRSSIEEIGLIQPVLLRKKPNGYQIVCGFRRISIFHELRIPEIESRVVGEKEMDESNLFLVSLHENLTTRGFNAVEIAIALEKLVHSFQIERTVVVNTFLPLFSLEPNEKILNTYLSLAQMEDEVKTYVLKEEVSRSNIRRLATLNPHDRISILSLISPLKLSESRLREILTLLEEISRRNQCPGRDIVQRSEIQAILSQKELTSSQKTERVKKILMDLRYPRMRGMEEKYEEKKRELNLSSNISLHHPTFFEGKGLRVGFQFETIEEYRSILSSLSQLGNKAEFREMLEDKHQITSTNNQTNSNDQYPIAK